MTGDHLDTVPLVGGGQRQASGTSSSFWMRDDWTAEERRQMHDAQVILTLGVTSLTGAAFTVWSYAERVLNQPDVPDSDRPGPGQGGAAPNIREISTFVSTFAGAVLGVVEGIRKWYTVAARHHGQTHVHDENLLNAVGVEANALSRD
jgi:hypothetical protein